MHRLGEIRDRKPENQSYRASVLTLLTAAISLWNTVYMERAIDALKRKGLKINEQLLSHLSPLAWEHINLTGDYIWKSNWICKHPGFNSMHFLRYPVFQPSAGTLPASGCSGIHEAARCYIPSASAL